MSAVPRSRHVIRRAVGSITAAGICLILVLSYPRGLVWTERAMTEHEWVLFAFAGATGEPALCRQISWDAFERYPVLFGGGGASFKRSDCYEAVAEARGDPDVCWAVRPLVDLDPFSSGYSALSCRRNVRTRSYPAAYLSDDRLVHAFEELGYNVDDLYRADVIGPPVIKPEDVYVDLAHNSIAIPRAQALLRDPDTLAADDAAYLADMVAISTGHPEWCERIRAGIILREVREPFRDWCLLSVAANTHDPRICDRISAAANLQARCTRDARNGPTYLFDLPPDQLQTRRLISALGFAMPSPRSWPVPERADIFRRFLIRLGPNQKDAAHQAARSELVRRLLRDDRR